MLESDRLDEVSLLAEQYAKLALRDQREERPQRIVMVEKARTFNPLEMAYFCQQVVSYIPDVHKASMILTVFTNRLRG